MDTTQPEIYQIRVGGHLDPGWCEWFDGANIQMERDRPPITVLTCRVVDQAALHGILGKIRDLNLKLLDVKRLGCRLK